MALVLQEATFLCLCHPRARRQSATGHPYSPHLLKLFTPANLRWFAVSHLACPWGTPISVWPQRSLPCAFFCLLSLWCLSQLALHSMPGLLSLGPVSINIKLCFPKPLLCLLLWLPLTDHLLKRNTKQPALENGVLIVASHGSQ